MYLYIDMYHKDSDSDTRNYFLLDSCHPHHTKTNITLVCSPIMDDEEIHNQHLNQLNPFVNGKRYPVLLRVA